MVEISNAEPGPDMNRRRQVKEAVRRHREKRAAQDLIKAAAKTEQQRREAIEAERKAEFLAPSIRRQIIVEKGAPDRVIVGPRVRIENGYPAKGAEFSFCPQRSRRAARQLYQDWEEVGEGPRGGTANYLGVSGSGSDAPIAGKNAAMIAQIETRRRLEAALIHAGGFVTCLHRVVIQCVPVADWAQEAGKTVTDAIQHVRDALARLADFYHPPKEMAPTGLSFPTFAPPRGAYHTPSAGDFTGEDFDDRGRLRA